MNPPFRFVVPLSILFLSACQNVPITGRSQLQMITPAEEARMGLAAYQDVLKKEKLSHDPVANERVARVGGRIAAATGRADYPWEFKVIDDEKSANAFCLPGGKVAVYSGLLPIAQDDAGLAAVLGHEVAHAIARHGGERLSQQLLLEGITVAVVLGSRDEHKGGVYASLLGLGGALGFLLPYSRLHESEADRLGLVYMAKAGYDPHAAVQLWKRMAAQDKARLPEFLSTHPVEATRIEQLERWLPEAMRYYTPRP